MRGIRFGVAVLAMVAAVGQTGCAVSSKPDMRSRASADKLAADIQMRQRSGTAGVVAQSDIDLFARIFERVRADYVSPVDESILLAAASNAVVEAEPPGDATGNWLVEQAIRGMLAKLDPYTAYLSREEYAAMQDSMRGHFGGLGIRVAKPEQGGGVLVVESMNGTPAARAGLRSGDLIVGVDGRNVDEVPMAQTVGMLRGRVGTSVVLTIRRARTADFDVTLMREEIHTDTVEWRREGRFGYLKIGSFSEDTGTQVRQAVREIRLALGGSLSGLIVDLRDNPGGLLTESVAVSDDFMERGEIVSTRSRTRTQHYRAGAGDIVDGIPIVLLVNGGSASAAEILAGALKDHGRAVLVGSRTYGKGTVQTVIPMGQGTALKLTTARYYLPFGGTVDQGIKPDVEATDIEATETDEALDQALAELNRLARL